MKISHLAALALCCTLAACNESEPTATPNTLDTLEAKASYGFGVDYTNRLKSQSIVLDTEAFIMGIQDASSGTPLKLDSEALKQAMTEYATQLRDEIVAKQQAEAETNLAAGKAFLDENAKKEGIVTTASGLQYKIITAGTGATPTADDIVVTHYRGTLIDGREFDSSYARNEPATFPVGGVIKGWTEALQLMKVGAKWQLFVPSDLAYGATKRSDLILPNTTLVFDIELLEVKPKS